MRAFNGLGKARFSARGEIEGPPRRIQNVASPVERHLGKGVALDSHETQLGR
jgi:hypothetical protein